MAFTRAAEVAALVQRHVLPGVAVSLGQATGASGIEVIIRGYSHPMDGMSRVWHIELAGQSGPMLDMVIIGLRKAGFEMSGSAPLMKGRLTQVLDRVEKARMNAAAREQDRKKEQAQLKADLQAETAGTQAQQSERIEELQAELGRLREMLEDIALMPQPRGPQGAQGVPGADGKDGSIEDLAEAQLSDLGDVLEVQATDAQVLTWKDGKWQPLFVPRISGPISPGGGGGGGTGGGSFNVHERQGASGAQQGTVTGITDLSFDTESGFGLTDLGNGEALLQLNSTFNPWQVSGETSLDATGEEPVEFVAGPGVTITTDASANPKQIKWEVSGGASGGIPEAPQDNRFYLRRNGAWYDLTDAMQMMIDGSNVTTGSTDSVDAYQIDGGNFNTGNATPGQPLEDEEFDGGDVT